MLKMVYVTNDAPKSCAFGIPPIFSAFLFFTCFCASSGVIDFVFRIISGTVIALFWLFFRFIPWFRILFRGSFPLVSLEYGT